MCRRIALAVLVLVARQVYCQVDLRLSAVPSSACVPTGGTLTYRLTVIAAAGASATGVVLRQRLPAGASLVSADATCSACGEFVTCDLGSLSTWPRQLNVSIAVAAFAHTALSAVSVFGQELDPDARNNTVGPVSVAVQAGGPGCLTVEAVAPLAMPSAGGLAMTVEGETFASGATLRIGGYLVGDATVIDSETIAATAPALPPGAYDVTVTNPGGATSTLFGGYHAYTVPSMQFHSVAPCRVVDTRDPGGGTGGAPLEPGELRVFNLLGLCGLPSTARAVVRNVTAVAPASQGSLALGPGDLPLPGTSAVSFRPGRTIANNGFDRLATDGSCRLAVRNDSTGSVHAVVDVSGYFE